MLLLDITPEHHVRVTSAIETGRFQLREADNNPTLQSKNVDMYYMVNRARNIQDDNACVSNKVPRRISGSTTSIVKELLVRETHVFLEQDDN